MEKKRIINLIDTADIEETDWHYYILESITDKYAKGYLSARISALNNSFDYTDEQFREELLEYCTYDIWNK